VKIPTSRSSVKTRTQSASASAIRAMTTSSAVSGVTVIGGHTEITAKLDRPILVGTLIGEVDRERLVTPQGAREGDRILLTKGVPIEATAILAREFPDRARRVLSAADLRQARAFLYDPGISVLREARIAQQAGQVTAMHDPTEGGLATALWELAESSGRALTIDRRAVPIPPLAARVCQAFGLDPLNAIASTVVCGPSATTARIATGSCAGGGVAVTISVVVRTEAAAKPRRW